MTHNRKSFKVALTIVVFVITIVITVTAMPGAVTIEAPWGCPATTPTIVVPSPESPLGEALAWECPGCPGG